MKILLFIIIYLIGYIISYYLTRFSIKKSQSSLFEYEWSYTDVLYCALFSVGSWVMVIAILIALIIDKFEKRLLKYSNKKPPR